MTRSLLRRLSSALRFDHLLVDGGQLFVGRLQLFLGRLQFLVDALQFFVGGLDFLVGRLEFLVGRLVLLLHGLEVLARLGEIGFEFGDAARFLLVRSAAARPAAGATARRAAARPVLSASSNRIRKQRSRRFFSGMTSRFTVRVSPSRLTRTFSLRTVLFSFFALLIAARSGSIKPFARHLQHVEARLAGGRLEVRAGRPAELQDLQSALISTPGGANWLTVMRSASRCALSSPRKPSGGSARRRPSADRKQAARRRAARSAALFPDRQVKRRGRRGLLGEDLVLLVHRLEEIGEAADRFRGAQEQEPAGLERVVERGQHLLLQARLEIDQQVAATDEVHARERRIGDEVLPREDHHLAQRLADPVAAFLLDEEPPQPLGRDVLRRGSWRRGRGGPCRAAPR